MTNKNIYISLGGLDPELIIKAAPDNKVRKKSNIWVKWAALAACIALIISAVIVVPMLRDSGDIPTVNQPNYYIPSISTIASGNKITGKQELIYGNPSSGSEQNADIYPPGFDFGTVVEIEVIEVLPDTYYNPEYYSRPLHVAKLRVIDSALSIRSVAMDFPKKSIYIILTMTQQYLLVMSDLLCHLNRLAWRIICLLTARKAALTISPICSE